MWAVCAFLCHKSCGILIGTAGPWCGCSCCGCADGRGWPGAAVTSWDCCRHTGEGGWLLAWLAESPAIAAVDTLVSRAGPQDSWLRKPSCGCCRCAGLAPGKGWLKGLAVAAASMLGYGASSRLPQGSGHFGGVPVRAEAACWVCWDRSLVGGTPAGTGGLGGVGPQGNAGGGQAMPAR